MQILDLSIKPQVKGAKHWTASINQLYHPLGKFGQDSQDIVYTRDSFGLAQFTPILLKEWFYLVKTEGFLVIDYKSSKENNFQKLEETIWWLWQGQFEIVYHGSVATREQNNLTLKKLVDYLNSLKQQEQVLGVTKSQDQHFRLVVKKTKATKIPGDDINKWTFGMITKGERNDWIEEIITSIRAQKIPNYEIIICGTYFDRGEKDIRYIPFKERDDKAWITKKKNTIAKNATYENLCIIHDRIIFDKDWFAGIKKYGNAFDVLCNAQILKGSTLRTGDWLTYGNKTLNMPYGISELEYNDWDKYVYMGGQLSILKKSVWEKCPWNETLYWGEEDVELSFRFRDSGSLIRFNPYSKTTALTWRFGKLPSKYYFSEGFLPKDMLLRRFLRQGNKLIFSVPVIKAVTFPIVKKIVSSKVYTVVIRK